MNLLVKRIVMVAAAAFVVALMMPATATAMAPDPGADPDADDDRNWGAGAGVRMMVGQGTFVSPSNDTEFADEVDDGSGAYDRVMANLGVTFGYAWNGFEFGASTGFTQALTPGGGPGGTRPYEGRIQDIELEASHEDGFEIGETGISISPSFGADLPLSTASRTQTMLTSLSAGASISKSFFESLALSFSLGGSRTFHQYTSPIIDEEEVQDDEFTSRLFRPDGTEDIGGGRFAHSSINNQWGLSTGVGAMVMFSPKIMMMAQYSINNSWTYDVVDRDDEFSSEYQCENRCASQMSMGMIMLNYTLSENLMVMGGVTTTQRPKTADNKTFNFPFYNFDRPAANNSMFSIGISGSY